MMKKLNGKKLLDSIQEGGSRIIAKRIELNSINVFPVADADTGNNLSSLMRSLNNISNYNDDISIEMVLSLVSQNALEYGKGNSGMIFAQYLNGVSRFYVENNQPERMLINALSLAVDDAYNAVQNPQEGTILTVIKDWTNKLQNVSDIYSFTESLLIAQEAARVSVLKTKHQHKVMKKNEVVDAGAKGFLLFIEGFTDVLLGLKTKLKHDSNSLLDKIKDEQIHVFNEIPNFRYCMEIIYSSNKHKISKKEVQKFGDSIVIVEGKNKSKLHIHTNHPKDFLLKLNKDINVSNIKVDDMHQQYFDQNVNNKSIAIVTDSIADLSEADLTMYNIHVLPLIIMVDEIEHLDKLTIDNKTLYKFIDSGKRDISTSLPSQTNILRMFEGLEQSYKEVLFISVSSKLSGTYNAIINAKKVYEGPLSIEVVDSKLNSIAQGLLVKIAGKYIEEGMSFESLIKNIKHHRNYIDIFVSVTDLGPMIQSGRISKTLGKVFKKINVLPIISLDKNGKGKLSNLGFSLKNVENKIVKKILYKHIDDISIGYTSDIEDTQVLKSMLEMKNIHNINTIQTSSIIALSAGRHSTAVAVNYRIGR